MWQDVAQLQRSVIGKDGLRKTMHTTLPNVHYALRYTYILDTHNNINQEFSDLRYTLHLP